MVTAIFDVKPLKEKPVAQHDNTHNLDSDEFYAAKALTPPS